MPSCLIIQHQLVLATKLLQRLFFLLSKCFPPKNCLVGGWLILLQSVYYICALARLSPAGIVHNSISQNQWLYLLHKRHLSNCPMVHCRPLESTCYKWSGITCLVRKLCYLMSSFFFKCHSKTRHRSVHVDEISV